MSYRFTNTDKWEKDGWFIDLKPMEKLLFIYLCETCDIAGFKELAYRKITFDTGMTEQGIQGALKGLQRGLVGSLDGTVIYIRNFIKHQKNLPLNPDNKAHVGIINRLNENLTRFGFTSTEQFVNCKINEGALKGLPSPSGKGKGIGNGIEKVKEFYLSELAKSENHPFQEPYKLFIDFLLGENKENDIGILDVPLSIEKQVSFENFITLKEKVNRLELQLGKKISIARKLKAMQNKPSLVKGKVSLYLTLSDWVERG